MEENQMNPMPGEQENQAPATNAAVSSCFDWMDSLSFAIIIVVFLFTFLFRLPEVVGPSMLPNLEEGDRVVVSCLERNFRYDDVVVVESAGTDLEEKIIKRVIATEGQEVNIDFETGTVYVDGKALDESAYIENGITTREDDMEFPQVVPKGHVFLLGDNREVSLDSRDTRIGMVDSRHILGKVHLIAFPFQRFGGING